MSSLPVADKPLLLLIDDEERILRSLSMLFRMQYRVKTTTDPRAALAMLAAEPVHVIVSDQKMPLMRGADLLRLVKDRSPNTMRILLTGYSELDAVVDSVNEGEIFRYINKPWDALELRSTVEQAAKIAERLFAAPAAAAALLEPLPVMAVPAGASATSRAVAPPALPYASEAVLVIDDDREIYDVVLELAGSQQAVHWAQSVDQAFALLEQHPIGVIVSELSVKRESLTAALKLLKAQHPEVVTIVITPFADTDVLVRLINEGQVYRLLPKPVRRGPLSTNLLSALRQHRALKSMPLLRERHAVEAIRTPEESGLASRVRGFLGRLRGRNLNS